MKQGLCVEHWRVAYLANCTIVPVFLSHAVGKVVGTHRGNVSRKAAAWKQD
jgi:hypothetical protein